MAKYLINTTEIYRVDEEYEAEDLINDAKLDSTYELKKYSSERKEKSDDSYYKVTLVKTFTEEKEPVRAYEAKYTVAGLGE